LGLGKKKVGAAVVGADENNTNQTLLKTFKNFFEHWVVGTTRQQVKKHF
jgi:hypothetical protein